MKGLVLMRETRAPRETPRLAWLICAALAGIVILPDFGWRHSIVEQVKSLADLFDNTPAASVPKPFMGPPRMTVPVDSNRRCRVRLTINGKGPFFAIIDTGAPDTLLPAPQAARLGYDLSRMKMDHANGGWGGGHVSGVYVDLHELRLGDFVLHGFHVGLDRESGFDEGLLGITFLQRLQAFEIAGGQCRLWW